MLKKLYEHLCDKVSAIMKADKTVSDWTINAVGSVMYSYI